MINPMLARLRDRRQHPVVTAIHDAYDRHYREASRPQPRGMVGQECPCVIVPRVLIALGAKNAARMHKKGEGRNGWSVQDWRDHLADEERYFFPMLLRVAAALEATGRTPEAIGLRNAIQRLGREHGVVRRDYLDKDLLPPDSITRRHGIAEDAIIVKYEPEIYERIKLEAA